MLSSAEQEMSPILHYATEHAGLLSATLYACLATYTAEEPLELVRDVEGEHGFEAWRNLVQNHEPKTSRLKAMWLQKLMPADFKGDEAAYARKFRQWERDCRTYQKLIGGGLDVDIKIHLLVEGAPPGLREYLHLQADLYRRSYERLRAIIVNWLQAKHAWFTDSGGVRPMEIDRVKPDAKVTEAITAQCRNDLNGTCNRGSRCRYVHDERLKLKAQESQISRERKGKRKRRWKLDCATDAVMARAKVTERQR